MADPQPIAISGIDDPAKVRVVLLASGRQVHAPLSAVTAGYMEASVYDPQGIEADAFDLANMTGIPADLWAFQPIGVPIPVWDHLDASLVPPLDKDYRYALLTAGESGAGAYNDGVLTGESVSGSSPLVIATAVVSLAGSPLDGKTVSLINTEGRFVRAHTTSGLLANDAAQNFTGSVTFNTSTANSPIGVFDSVLIPTSSRGASGTASGATFSIDLSRTNRTANETRPKMIGAHYYMRLK